MPSIYKERPEKEQVALAYLAAEELLTPISGPFPKQPNPADQKVPSWNFESLSFTHLIFPYAERRIKVVGAERPDALDVPLTAEQLLPAVSALIDSGWGYLASIIGVDLGVEAGQFEVLYVFCAGAAVLVLTVQIPRETAVIPSVCGIIPSASIHERELMEMFGITVEDTPNPNHLFLPDDWPQGVLSAAQELLTSPPLEVKQSDHDPNGTANASSFPSALSIRRSRSRAILSSTVDGETVTAATVRLGYVHRGIEKGHRSAQLDAESLPAGTGLRHLLAHSRHDLLPGRGETGRR